MPARTRTPAPDPPAAPTPTTPPNDEERQHLTFLLNMCQSAYNRLHEIDSPWQGFPQEVGELLDGILSPEEA